MLDKRKFYINGEWISPYKPNDFNVINQSNEDSFAVISLGAKEDVDKAVDAAKIAFEKWKNTTKEQRINLLEKLLKIYKRRFDEMSKAISDEISNRNLPSKKVNSVVNTFQFMKTNPSLIEDDNFLVSPADGEVIKVEEVNGPKELSLENKQFKKISIFMNVFDCHVTRTPCSGKIEEILYKPGKFFNASLDKASEENERNYFKIKDHQNNHVILVQIAGLIARRIVCESNKDQELQQGDRIGMIRFGSRADIYYENYEPLVKVGQKAISGETLLAKK